MQCCFIPVPCSICSLFSLFVCFQKHITCCYSCQTSQGYDHHSGPSTHCTGWNIKRRVKERRNTSFRPTDCQGNLKEKALSLASCSTVERPCLPCYIDINEDYLCLRILTRPLTLFGEKESCFFSLPFLPITITLG